MRSRPGSIFQGAFENCQLLGTFGTQIAVVLDQASARFAARRLAQGEE